MRIKLILISLILSFSVITEAQISVVQKYRSQYPTPLGSTRAQYEENSVKLLKQIALEIKGGILKKTSGNNCQGYSCDFVCFPDGRGFDVLIDSDGQAIPTWNGPQVINGASCELVTEPIPNPEPTPAPPDETVVNLLKEIRDILKDIRTLLQ